MILSIQNSVLFIYSLNNYLVNAYYALVPSLNTKEIMTSTSSGDETANLKKKKKKLLGTHCRSIKS